MNWSGEKNGNGIEYHVMLLSLLLIAIVRGCGANRSLANILGRNGQLASRKRRTWGLREMNSVKSERAW
jgi:hypothetical protein